MVAVGGVFLARRESLEREVTDRSSLHTFASSLQGELVRLDALYERHVRELTLLVDESNTIKTQRECQKLAGVKSCSLLRAREPENPVHIRVDGSGSQVPLATIKPMLGGQHQVLPLSQELSTGMDAPDSGWEATADASYVIYWQRRSSQLAVALTIDVNEIAAINRQHIHDWTEGQFAPVTAQHGLAQLKAPDNTILAQSENFAESRSPDFVAPLSSRSGLWQVLAWDRLITRTVYHEPTLYGAAILSAVLALLGVMLSRSQWRTQLLAEQRVSFVNRVSHELGTPLTNMLLNLDLTRELVDTQPEEAKRRLALAEEETRRLTRLTANVLTFSHCERNTLELHPAAWLPGGVLQQTLVHFMPALQRRGIAVETFYQEQESVLLDADALAQIIANLISNVEKYAASGAWLRLESAWSNDQLVVKVSDRGPGIPEKDRERLFQPFERLTNHLNEGNTGTGLGLTIARDLAERMGGTLTIDHEDNKNILVLQIPAPSAVKEQEAGESPQPQINPTPA